MNSFRNKSGAVELSVSTLIIIVLGVSMLILGIVLVRSILCGAVGLSGEVNDKVRGEMNNLFGASTEGEIQCLGATEPVDMFPDQTNNVYCSVRAKEPGTYSFEVVSYSSDSTSITPAILESWVIQKSFSANVAPGSTEPIKVAKIKIPAAAPEAQITLGVDVKKDGVLVTSTRVLDFSITRQGVIQGAIC